MFEKNTIGLVGHGFVGEALEVGMKYSFNVLVHDPYKYGDVEFSNGEAFIDGENGKILLVDSIMELVKRAEVIFVAVPTPMKSNGKCDISIIENVISEISECSKKFQEKQKLFLRQHSPLRNGNVVVIKSTVPPGTTAMLNEKYSHVDGIKAIVFNPEFLTEANYINDFKEQTRIIIGSEHDDAKSKIKQIYQKAYPKTPTIKTSSRIAEMVKYTTNCFLATKLSFANEISQICESLNIDYDKVIEYFLYDERIGKTHLTVPGPDGDKGWGGHCFPKDLNALRAVAKENGILSTVLDAAWEKNMEVRKNRDWEKMVGRAVSKE